MTVAPRWTARLAIQRGELAALRIAGGVALAWKVATRRGEQGAAVLGVVALLRETARASATTTAPRAVGGARKLRGRPARS
ncbi:MAG: hypothetical protein KF850_16650 [Labilithrix sp.]|nr:hypothetical protein [Labilithrix sp.]